MTWTVCMRELPTCCCRMGLCTQGFWLSLAGFQGWRSWPYSLLPLPLDLRKVLV